MKWINALFALVLATPVLADNACPAGQYQACVVVCFCMPVGDGQPGEVFKDVENMATASLVFALRQARDEATANGTQPIPLHIRAQLEPWYDFAVLDAARYRVGDEQQISAANALLQNPDVNAVTLIDTVIFRRSSDAEDNVALWAHELKHVEQYQTLGVEAFARRYTRNYDDLEAPAYKIEAEVSKALHTPGAGAAR